MPRIRLLTSVSGGGAVVGDIGAEIEVDASTAKEWVDGERAERVIERAKPAERAVRR